MRPAFLAMAGAFVVIAAVSAQSQPAPPALPPYTSNPAELPKVFAVAIRAADMARSERFYKDALGASGSTKLTPRETMLHFPSGIGINLVQAAPGTALGEGSAGFIFQTADIDALAKRVQQAGGKVVRPPSDGTKTAGVRVAFISDLDGTRIEVIQFPQK